MRCSSSVGESRLEELHEGKQELRKGVFWWQLGEWLYNAQRRQPEPRTVVFEHRGARVMAVVRVPPLLSSLTAAVSPPTGPLILGTAPGEPRRHDYIYLEGPGFDERCCE